MDAMQKRRMLLVAAVPLALTVFAFMSVPHARRTTHFEEGSFMHWEFVYAFWTSAFYLLQPQGWVWFKLFNLGYLTVPTSGLFRFLEASVLLISIPLWSVCFGWLYVKFTNWLNHFPVLGRKVF
jgi:hypothetical protein